MEPREDKIRSLISDENPFKLPERYFDELPGKVMDQINSLPDFEKSSSVNPFQTPEGYFEKLPVVISETINSRKTGLVSWADIFGRPRFVIPLAFAILLAGLYFFSKKNISSFNERELTIDEIQNSTFFQSIDEDVFVDVLNTQKTTDTNDSLSQYLLDNNIDLSEIEKAL